MSRIRHSQNPFFHPQFLDAIDAAMKMDECDERRVLQTYRFLVVESTGELLLEHKRMADFDHVYRAGELIRTSTIG